MSILAIQTASPEVQSMTLKEVILKADPRIFAIWRQAHPEENLNQPLDNSSPLSFAVRNSGIAMTRALLEAGADAKAPSRDSPLIAAVIKGDAETAALLIASGADVNGVNPTMKKTALFYAISADNLQIAQQLVDAGANFKVKDSIGKDVLGDKLAEFNCFQGDAYRQRFASTLAFIFRCGIQLKGKHISQLNRGREDTELEEVVFGECGKVFEEELAYRKLLALTFTLSGNSVFGGREIRLEGSNEYVHFLPYFKCYPTDMSEEAKEASGLTKSDVLMSKGLLEQSHSVRTDMEHFRRLAGSSTEKRDRILPIQAAVKTAGGGHMTGYVLYRQAGAEEILLVKCNKGAGSQGEPGLHFYRVKNRNDFWPFFAATRYHVSSISFFVSGVDQLLGLEKDRAWIPQKPQKVGNCPIASLHSLQRAVLYLLCKEKGMVDAEAEEKSKIAHRDITKSIRFKILKDYLDLNSTPEARKQRSFDWALLNQILNKSYEVDQLNSRGGEELLERNALIADWLIQVSPSDQELTRFGIPEPGNGSYDGVGCLFANLIGRGRADLVRRILAGKDPETAARCLSSLKLYGFSFF